MRTMPSRLDKSNSWIYYNLGMLYLENQLTRHAFTPSRMAILKLLASGAAISIENARLYEELEEARTRLSLENEGLRREVLVEKHPDSIV